MLLNEKRKSRRGHPKLDKSDCRTNCVSVRLNDSELAMLEQKRGKLMRGEWLRMSALDHLPPTIPGLNQKAWVELSRAASNLNQIAANMNRGDLIDIRLIQNELAEFRNKLVGANNFDGSDF
ncbi:ATP-binding protein [Undibacterium sp. SXout11W]|uniref:ATP-binding protein n=1 Tax=Undibacterium sp. SXout11W TaxID=3413050 RepID=UPI003BF26FA9